MGYSIGKNANDRWIGYGVPSLCDHPSCNEKIHRGLDYRCEECGLFFCGEHLYMTQVCIPCENCRLPFKPKADLSEWNRHLLTHPSWAQWREENPEEVERLKLIELI